MGGELKAEEARRLATYKYTLSRTFTHRERDMRANVRESVYSEKARNECGCV